MLSVAHQGQLPAVTLSFNLAPGMSLGDAVRETENAQRDIGMPRSVQGSFAGTAQAFQASLASEPVLIVAALITVHIVFGMLYESFVHPITILSTLTSAGVVKKNAIMMIDFALDAERRGEELGAVPPAARGRGRFRLLWERAKLPGMTPQPTYDIARQLLASKDFFDRSTRVLEQADSEFRPNPETMTVAQQVAHVAQTLDWFIEGATAPEGFDLDFAKQAAELAAVSSLSAARAHLDAAFARAVEFCRSHDLSKPLPPGPIMGGQPMTDMVWAMVEHTAHHRGALSVYSRLLGKVPPMPYGG